MRLDAVMEKLKLSIATIVSSIISYMIYRVYIISTIFDAPLLRGAELTVRSKIYLGLLVVVWAVSILTVIYFARSLFRNRK